MLDETYFSHFCFGFLRWVKIRFCTKYPFHCAGTKLFILNLSFYWLPWFIYSILFTTFGVIKSTPYSIFYINKPTPVYSSASSWILPVSDTYVACCPCKSHKGCTKGLPTQRGHSKDSQCKVKITKDKSHTKWKAKEETLSKGFNHRGQTTNLSVPKDTKQKDTKQKDTNQKDTSHPQKGQHKLPIHLQWWESYRESIEQIHEYDNHQEDEDQEEHVAEPSRWIIVVWNFKKLQRTLGWLGTALPRTLARRQTWRRSWLWRGRGGRRTSASPLHRPPSSSSWLRRSAEG